MTSLLQPTKPAYLRAVFSAVLTRLTPSSTVRAWALLTVTSALPACLIAFQITSYWLKTVLSLELQDCVLFTHSLAFLCPLELECSNSKRCIKGAGNKSLIVACDANFLATCTVACVFAEQSSSEAVVASCIWEWDINSFFIHHYLVENILECQHTVLSS